MNGPLGTQWIVELNACASSPLEQVPFVRESMLEAARRARAEIVGDDFHQFAPYGVSGVVVLAQSHMTIHTWPEYGYAAVDFFFCSDEVDVEAAIDHLRDRFRVGRVDRRKLDRSVATDASLEPASEPRDSSWRLCLSDSGRESA